MCLLAFQSVYQAVLDIVKREGVTGLYSGLSSSLLGIAVTNGYVLFSRFKIGEFRLTGFFLNSVYYYFYERSRESILRSRGGPGRKALSTLESMLAGACWNTSSS